ncbi:MAG TPA: hypothetical protein VGP85_14220 [Pyrinomonadaceae bacterium]|nr:hypothetical protein [Pyrinomonadaceae bacterium]
MRRYLSLTILFLVLSCTGTVAAQDFLDEYKDENNPCDRFKMRILMPFNNADHTLPIKKTAGGIDHKMIGIPVFRVSRHLLTFLSSWHPIGKESSLL